MKKKNLIIACFIAIGTTVFGQEKVDSVLQLQEVTVTSLFRNNIDVGSKIDKVQIMKENYGQEPSILLEKLPGIYSYGDNGTGFGYHYFRLRGLGQERINYTIDGLPIIQESEDFGCYFSNMPDFIASMRSMKVERGAGVALNGSVGYAGAISFESTDLHNKDSYVDLGVGNFGTSRITAVYNSGLHNGWGFHIRGTMFGTNGYKEYSSNKSKALAFKVGYEFNKSHSIDFLSLTGYHENGQCFLGLPREDLPEHLEPFGKLKNGNDPRETDDFLLTVNRLQYKGWLQRNLLLTGSLYWSCMKGNYRMIYDGHWNYGLLHNLGGANISAKWWKNYFTLTTNINAQRFQRRHEGTELPGDTIITGGFHNKPYLKEVYINRGIKDDINVSEQIRYTYGNFIVQTNIQFRHTGLSYKVKKAFNNSDKPFDYTWNFINTGLDAYYKVGYSKLYLKWATVGKEPSRTDILGGEFNTGEYAVSNPECNERVQDIETGWEYKGRKLLANINLYYMNFDNELVATGLLSEQNGLPLHQPLDGYRMGIEVSSTWMPTKNIRLTENMSLSKNKLSDYKTHPYSPSFISYTEAEWISDRLSVGLNLTGHSKVYVDLDNKFDLGSVINLGGYIGYKINNNVGLKLSLTNITNRLNTPNGSTDGEKVYYNIDTPFSMFANLNIKL